MGFFFVFFVVVYSGKSVWAFFFTRVVWHIYQRKRSFTGNITSSQTKKMKNMLQFLWKFFIVFLFFFLLMIRLFECRFMIY